MQKMIDNYEEARLQFKTMGLNLKSNYKLEQWSFDVGNGLTMDTINFLPEANENLLVITTGIHGIEGYVGNFCLQIFVEELLHKIDLERTKVVLVHGINPYGMKYYRKVNEDNVDLNRNFLTHEDTRTENTNYQRFEHLFNLGHLEGDYNMLKLKFQHEMFKKTLTMSPKTIRDALLAGQYSSPKGLFYGGQKVSESSALLMTLFDRLLSQGFNQKIFIDIHSGYGAKYTMNMVNDHLETRTTDYFKKAFNYPHIRSSEEMDYYETKGDLTRYISERMHVNDYATAFEFGTYGAGMMNDLRALRLLVFENMVHEHHQEEEHVYRLVKKRFKELFIPSQPKWLAAANENFTKAMMGILSHYDYLK